jgi:hypothetical protein
MSNGRKWQSNGLGACDDSDAHLHGKGGACSLITLAVNRDQAARSWGFGGKSLRRTRVGE